MSPLHQISRLLDASELNPMLIQAWQQALPGLSDTQQAELGKLLAAHLEQLRKLKAERRETIYQALEAELTRQVNIRLKAKEK